MPARHKYEVADGTNNNGEDPSSLIQDPNPIHASKTDGSRLSSQRHDQMSPALLPNEKGSQLKLTFYEKAFTNGWGWELLALFIAAVSLLTLVVVFVVFKNKSLSQWSSGLSPNTIVSVLSQIGQTAVLVPVTSCICQSMWIWLGNGARITDTEGTNTGDFRLIDMQAYDYGGRSPIGSLLLLWKNPGRYSTHHEPFRDEQILTV